jgi:Transcription factor WhiB
LFFADDPFSQRLAVTICRCCPVRQQCEADVLATESPTFRYGVRAGYTATERRRWGVAS